MKNDVSRRNFVALAGAGVALAACGKDEDAASGNAACVTVEDDTVPGAANSDYKFLGYPAIPYGDDPHDRPAYNFTPKFISILHVTDDGPWGYDINHAHFEIDENTDEAGRLSAAITRLQKKILALPRKKRFGDITDQSLKPYVKKRYNVGEVCDYTKLEKIEYNSQNELFIFIESKKIALENGKLISFSNGLSDGTKAEENHSFYWATLVPQAELGAIKNKGQMIRLRNYCRAADGTEQTDKPELKHSLNIHFGATLKGGGFVPMVIDPNTGNGSGNEP
jgi:hypothetical protein